MGQWLSVDGPPQVKALAAAQAGIFGIFGDV